MSGISAARHHADWLSLVEVSGPFVSMPVLLKTFPQGLDQRDPAQAKALRTAHEEWQDNPTAPGRQRAWLLHVFSSLLGYPADLLSEGQTLPAGVEANMAELGETLRPDFALIGPKINETAGNAHLLIASYPADQALDRPVIGKHWKASPATRMTELLHASGVAVGLLTNGEHWMLVFAPRGETTGYASWFSALWLEEPITLRAFHSLLGVHRFFGVAADNTLLGLLKESAQDQQEVTDQLGYQVREAVEVLVQAFDTLDQDANRILLKGLSETALYDAALTVMMRLVFLFSAEERGLLHLGKPLYDDNYAVSTLLEQLQETADLNGPQVLERRIDAWARLLATFRAVHGGVHHQDLLMPAYGGSLFDPDRYPFLEGRGRGTSWTTTDARPLAINNRVALHLLTSLQKLRMKIPGGGTTEPRRVSFRALGVEQIGHVYEGLLDHTAVRATAPILGLKGTRDKEAEIPLATLEAKARESQDTLIEFLKEESGRSLSALTRAIDEVNANDEHKLLIACGHDRELLRRVRPFAGLVREDSFERPVVVLPGSVYVTVGTTRRTTGTHYTPPSLTEPIVRYTLEPLVYEGPAQDLPREQWQLKTPKEILDLNVCDMAMGSGAFLVQACRYLAERLTEAWETEEKKHPNEVLATPEGGFSRGVPSERLVPHDAAERLAIAKRIVADRCLYGVDINPMAVEMAKLSLWLITLDAKRPFTFLDHAFKSGDSLLGLSSFKQLENFSLRPEGGKQIAFSTMNLWQRIDEAKKKREALEAMPSNTPEQIAAKVALYGEAEEVLAKLKAAADVLVAIELKGLRDKKYDEAREEAADHMLGYWERGVEELQGYADQCLNGHKTLHWPLAFPEIFGRGGFNALVGNPPYLGGPKLTGAFGKDCRDFWIRHIAHGRKGTADLAAYFCLRAHSLAAHGGNVGLVVTSSVAEGDTREVGLQQLQDMGATLFGAVQRNPWPGSAKVTYTAIWIHFGEWTSYCLLDGRRVKGITSYLTEKGQNDATPFRLTTNIERSFNGAKVYGEGFVIDDVERELLLNKDPRNNDVIFPYLTTDDLNSHPDCSASKWAIRFFEWPLNRESAPANYQGPVAADYPDCLAIVETRVKPERTRRNGNGDFVLGAPLPQKWWIYARTRPALYGRLKTMERALAIGTQATKYVAFAFVSTKTVFSHSLAIIADDSLGLFAALSSSLHEVWARRYGSYNLALLRYSPSDLFDTFPLPPQGVVLNRIGSSYYQERHALMGQRGVGLTDIYNSFHDPYEKSEGIARLQALHVEMDQAVAAAYGWSELELGHGFHKTKQGLRYTISDVARREVLDRLLALNHQRHAEESKTISFSANAKPTGKRGRKPKTDGDVVINDLFASGEDQGMKGDK